MNNKLSPVDFHQETFIKYGHLIRSETDGTTKLQSPIDSVHYTNINKANTIIIPGDLDENLGIFSCALWHLNSSNTVFY